MLKLSFTPYPGAVYERVEVQILNDSVDYDDLLSFFSTQYPKMCGPISLIKDGFEMVKTGEGCHISIWGIDIRPPRFSPLKREGGLSTAHIIMIGDTTNERDYNF